MTTSTHSRARDAALKLVAGAHNLLNEEAGRRRLLTVMYNGLVGGLLSVGYTTQLFWGEHYHYSYIPQVLYT